jgi:alkylation response protein AidB-like acyl-CoA dehydrogenase
MNERIALSGAGSIGGDVSGGSAIGQLISRHAPVTDPLMRQRLAHSYISNQIITWNNQRAAARRRSGGEAGPEGSITKLQQALHNQELQKLAVDLEGTGGMAWEGPSLTSGRRVDRVAAADTSAAGTVRGFLRSQANTIEGGTSNIMRNILGERVLGLPKEPDVSRELPWRDVPRSA